MTSPASNTSTSEVLSAASGTIGPNAAVTKGANSTITKSANAAVQAISTGNTKARYKGTSTSGSNLLTIGSTPASTSSPTAAARLDSNDVNNILDRINRHLAKWKQIDQSQFNFNQASTTENTVLDMGNGSSINYLCMLHYLSGRASDFLAEQATDSNCSNSIKAYLDSDNAVNLSKLINLSTITDVDAANTTAEQAAIDLKFYQNLYHFDVEMARYVATAPAFKAASITTQNRVLENLRLFTKQSISYIHTFMHKNTVIDDKLLNSSYDLMYLLSILSLQRANTGRSVAELSTIYQRVLDAIHTNLSLYDQIDVNKLTQVDATGLPSRSAEITVLYNELAKRRAELEAQHAQLVKNVGQLNSDANSLVGHVTEPVKEIGASLRAQLGSLATSPPAVPARVPTSTAPAVPARPPTSPPVPARPARQPTTTVPAVPARPV